MAESLDEKFPYSLEIIVYRHFPCDSVDYREAKTLGTILWIIRWSNGFDEVHCFEIGKRAIANYGSAFDFDEREVAWAIIRLIEKRILSSVFMGPVNDLSIRSSAIPAIKIVKVNNNAVIADALYFDPVHKIIRRSEGLSYLKDRNIQSYSKRISDKNGISIDSTTMIKMQSEHHSSVDLCKN